MSTSNFTIMRKNNLWNRIFFKKEIRKNIKDAELQLTLSKNKARIITAIEKCDSLYELMDIHKKAWTVGFQNVNLGPNKYGVFRTESIPTMKPEEVFLGNIWGLPTRSIPFWEERKLYPHSCNGFGMDTKTNMRAYDIVLNQYKNLLYFNIVACSIKTKQLLLTYKEANYLK